MTKMNGVRTLEDQAITSAYLYSKPKIQEAIISETLKLKV